MIKSIHQNKIYTLESDKEQDIEIGDFRGFLKQNTRSDDKVLEIGPSYMPLMPKSEGYNVKIIDHADREALTNKYAALGVDTSRIENVDYIWTGQSINELVQDDKFDLIVASHVIEHTTDMLSFLNGCLESLSPDGLIALIVPDKRYCFDYFQPITDAAKVIADHIRSSSLHTLEALYREEMQVVADYQGGQHLAWWQGKVDNINLMRSDPLGRLRQVKEASMSTNYIDAHEYFFVPASFRLIIEEIFYLKLLPISINLLTRSRGCEFLVTLKRSESKHNVLSRYLELKKELSIQILEEQFEAYSRLALKLEKK